MLERLVAATFVSCMLVAPVPGKQIPMIKTLRFLMLKDEILVAFGGILFSGIVIFAIDYRVSY